MYFCNKPVKMPYKSWFYLGVSFGVLRSNWFNSEARIKSSGEEKRSIEGSFEQIEEYLLEETWKEDSAANCIHAIQQLRFDIFKLREKYNAKEVHFSP